MIKKLTHPAIFVIAALFGYWFLSFAEYRGALAAGFLICLLALIIFMEYRFCYEARSRAGKTEIKQSVVFFFIAIAVAVLVGQLNDVIYPDVTPLEQNWPLWLEILVALVLSEFGFYWYHRLGHTVPWLWKVHGLHHDVRKVNIGTYFYMHPIDMAMFKICRTLPLIFIGFSAEAIYMTLIVQQTQKFLMHSNTGGTIGFLNSVLISAELHRMHHSTVTEEAGNFGGVLSVWDVLFGTFRTHKNKAPDKYGLVEGQTWPDSFWGGMLYPFTGRKN